MTEISKIRPFLHLMKMSSQELPVEEKAAVSADTHRGRDSAIPNMKKDSAGSSTHDLAGCF